MAFPVYVFFYPGCVTLHFFLFFIIALVIALRTFRTLEEKERKAGYFHYWVDYEITFSSDSLYVVLSDF